MGDGNLELGGALEEKIQNSIRNGAPLSERDELIRQLCRETLNYENVEDHIIKSILSHITIPEPSARLILIDFISGLLGKKPENINLCVDELVILLNDVNAVVLRETILLLCNVWSNVLPVIFYKPEFVHVLETLDRLQLIVFDMVESHLYDGLFRYLLLFQENQIHAYKRLSGTIESLNLQSLDNISVVVPPILRKYTSYKNLKGDVSNIVNNLSNILKKHCDRMSTSSIVYLLTTLSRIQIFTNGDTGMELPPQDIYESADRSQNDVIRIKRLLKLCEYVENNLKAKPYPQKPAGEANGYADGDRNSVKRNIAGVASLEGAGATKKPRLDDILTPELLAMLNSLPPEQASTFLMNNFDGSMIEELLNIAKGMNVPGSQTDNLQQMGNRLEAENVFGVDDPRMRAKKMKEGGGSKKEEKEREKANPVLIMPTKRAESGKTGGYTQHKPKQLKELDKDSASSLQWVFLKQIATKTSKSKNKMSGSILCKMVASLPPESPIRNDFLDYLLSLWPESYDIILKWAYHEYFSIIKDNKVDEGDNFSEFELEIMKRFIELEKSDTGDFIKLACEFPRLDDHILEYVQNLCISGNEMGYGILLYILRHRPSCTDRALNAIVALCFNANAEVRRRSLELIDSDILKSDTAEVEKALLLGKARGFLSKIASHESSSELFELCSLPAGEESPEKLKKAVALLLILPFNIAMAVPSFLLEIMKTYSKSSKMVKQLIHGEIAKLIKAKPELPPDDTLGELVRSFPSGSELLLLQILQLKTSNDKVLCDAVANDIHSVFRASRDFRFIIPIIPNLSKEEALQYLIDFVLGPKQPENGDSRSDLPKKIVETALTSLVSHPKTPLGPKDIIIEMHKIELKKEHIKKINRWMDFVMSFQDVVTDRVLASALYDLVNMNPLPKLLMRTALLTLKKHEKMVDQVIKFVLLPLINKEVWRNKLLWDGFIRICGETYPRCRDILRALPQQYEEEIMNLIRQSRTS